MKEFKGTKGEWKMSSKKWGCIELKNGTTLVCFSGSDNKEYNENDIIEANSNAKLIAAAPNLLDRLNALVLSVKAHPDYVFGEDGDEWHDLISLSEQAIKEATE